MGFKKIIYPKKCQCAMIKSMTRWKAKGVGAMD
jgi:hypothetical protein